MKISELSDRSGLPVQTIKYYIREGLLPKGTATAATRAEYDGRHLHRLRLIRALREVGGLPVASVQRIVAAVDDDTVALHRLLGEAQYALGPRAEPRPEDPDWRAARQDVDAVVAELGWRVVPDAPARDLLAQAFVALRRLGLPIVLRDLRPYIEAAGLVADHEVGGLSADDDRETAVQTAIATNVLYERVLLALRRMAQENASARRFEETGALRRGSSSPARHESSAHTP
ncbi:MerR family transcriptional regulator [Actinoallomurus spadix]|uniref:MerR family transcriptional regulator n=1 Tax=Actinoallomurus spadix TaxID=79912 RepID=A0ABN0XEC4_9ACTN|nr:MerR family transcriptional regulator [Actinoallomurus spadix]MCO5989843.1 MerR family transcriptional regulator [Actinoallomurus spadix]